MERELLERLVRLEEKVSTAQGQLEDLATSVKNLVDIYNQAKGMRWLAMTLLGAFTFVLGKVSGMFTWHPNP